MSMRERTMIDFEEGWEFMQKGITKLKNILEGLPESEFTIEDDMMLYTTIYNMCTQPPQYDHSRQLYDKYREPYEDYIVSTNMLSLDFLLEEENQTTSEMEMTNPSQEAEHNELLAKSLKEMMTKSMREFKASCRAEKRKKASEGTNEMNTEKFLSSIQRPEDVDPSMLGQRKGRKVKNEVVAEKILTFSLPANFDVATRSASDIDKVKERLGKWRIQRRERDTKSSDTYYCHLRSGQIFRSIPQVVSFIVYGTHPQLPKQTFRKRKVQNKTPTDSPTDQLGQKDENPNESFSCQSPSLIQLLNTTLEEEDFRDDRYFCVRDTFMLEEPQDLEASSSQHSIRFLESPRENDGILFLESPPSMNNELYDLLFSDSLVENNVQENNNGVNYNNLEADDMFDLTMNYRQEMIMRGGGGNHEGMMMIGSSVNENARSFMGMMNDGPHGDNILVAAKAMENEEVKEGPVNVCGATIDQLVIEDGGNEDKGLLEQLHDGFGSAQHNPELNELSMSWDEVDDDFFNVQPMDFFFNN